MRRETVVIVGLVAAVLAPMWYVSMHGEPPAEEIKIDQSVSEMRPLGEAVPMPNKLSPSQVGVIVWVALFALLGALTAVHRFMNRAVRPEAPAGEPSSGDGFPWFHTDDRWLAEYYDAGEGMDGVVVMGALTVLTVVFAALFTGEYLTLARTQYFGMYAGGMFFALAGLTVAYYAWFLPHAEVVEERGH
ncbi:MAG: hypothetical protein ABEJ34_06565 [Haloferacaceae archaeon]